MKALRFRETRYPFGRESLMSLRMDCKQRPWYRAEYWRDRVDEYTKARWLVFRWDVDGDNPSGHWLLIGTCVSWNQARRMIRENCKKDDLVLCDRLKIEIDRIERGLTPTHYTFKSFELPAHANEGEEKASL